MTQNNNILKTIIEDITNHGNCCIQITEHSYMRIESDKNGNIHYYVSNSRNEYNQVEDDANIKMFYDNIFIILLYNLLGYKLALTSISSDENEEHNPEWLKAANALDFNFKRIIDSISNRLESIEHLENNEIISNINQSIQNDLLVNKIADTHEVKYLLDTLDIDVNRLAKKLRIKTEKKQPEYNHRNEFVSKSNTDNEREKVVTNEPTETKLDTSMLTKANIPFEIINDREFITNPAVGRDNEIRKLGATLLTPSYSAMLLGESGVGKTAITEGLCYAIKNDLVSDRLKDKIIIKINVSSLVSGTKYVGTLEQKMEILIKFLKSNPNVILYIDEIHMVLGAGAGGRGNNDIANILKPHIENGSIKIIGATTFSEYDKYLTYDPAFTRRFKQISVKEPDRQILRTIIEANIEKFERITSMKFSNDQTIRDKMIEFIIDITDSKHRAYTDKRFNPGLALSIVEESFGYASYDLSTEVGTKYLKEAINNCDSIYKTAKEKLSYLDSLNNEPKTKCKIIDFNQKSNK